MKISDLRNVSTQEVLESPSLLAMLKRTKHLIEAYARKYDSRPILIGATDARTSSRSPRNELVYTFSDAEEVGSYLLAGLRASL